VLRQELGLPCLLELSIREQLDINMLQNVVIR
jgi:hypothetical protein